MKASTSHVKVFQQVCGLLGGNKLIQQLDFFLSLSTVGDGGLFDYCDELKKWLIYVRGQGRNA